MIEFATTICRFDKKGEKSGWSYIEISESQANKLSAGTKVSFRVMGNIDSHGFERVSLLPMGNGSFILPLNGTIRKAIGKESGQKVKVRLEFDDRKPTLSQDLITCLKDDPQALAYFKTLPKSHQNYFSNWIESAKTTQTKSKRIAMAVMALNKGQGFGEMIRANKRDPYQV
jgi:hypothetical protein